MAANKRGMVSVVVLVLSASFAWAQGSGGDCSAISDLSNGVRLTCSRGQVDVELLEQNVLRVDVRPDGKASPRTPVIDPELKTSVPPDVSVSEEGAATVIRSLRMTVTISHTWPGKISVTDAAGKQLVEQADPLGEAGNHMATFAHLPDENLYGMRGLERCDNSNTMLRNNGVEDVAAGAQGDGGAPLFFTTRYGLLIDSDGGSFLTQEDNVQFSWNSRKDVEYFVIAGPPVETMSAVATLTGRSPMPPKWTLGFLNSQWGSDEGEIKLLTATYRKKHIPIDAFILDYDWKAWGEDNYGEWRWNSTSGPGNLAPNKFPNGASGELAKELRGQGIKLAGILKPKILVYKYGSTTDMHEAAAYAEAHGLWYPGEPKLKETPAIRDLDFGNPETRSWYWKHLEPAFDAGMVAWWNDEADHTYVNWPISGGVTNFNNFQFLNMGRALYDGQRAHSDLRVWSINRNYYLGALRYGYAEWSGDIQAGFQSMQNQRMRMLSTLNIGEPHWSMDTGGFMGYHPSSPENYARWMEFAAFTPIFRVHGSYQEKRQPWVYGPIAEAAATHAIQLRYELLPYIYSYERTATDTGIGIVRPLFWMFPDDPKVANEGSSWMFGDAFLVSPVVARGPSTQAIYLPAGTWYDYFRGTQFKGGQTISYKVDPQTWQDIPLFVHDGTIIASQPVQDYVDEHPVTEVKLDVFPARTAGSFTYYDDDGTTYAYERGAYYRQPIHVLNVGTLTNLQFESPTGSFEPALRSYIVRVHGRNALAVLMTGKPLPKKLTEAQLMKTDESGWANGHDRFGLVAIIRVPAQRAANVVLR